MINEKRIYLMTQLAVFEKNHEKQLEGVQKSFRSDYIGRVMIKNGFRITAAFLLALAGWGLYNAETLIVDITKIDVKALGARILFLYAAVMCLFLLITYIVQTVRYARAKQDLYEYREMLRNLEKEYRAEEEREMPGRR
ncbi:MAG: hypothetical protein Q4F83_07035 [Eubacteriales bacterium]|nr:hypothetical protein [Eubacteriales bacterium]